MKYPATIASFLAVILISSVVSTNAYGLTLSLQESEDRDLSTITPQEAEDNSNKGKGKGGNSGKGSDDDEEKEKGKNLKIKTKNGGRGEVTEVQNNDAGLAQQAVSTEEDESLLFPVDFMLTADNGMAVASGNGKNNVASSRLDVSLDLNATTVRLEGNHIRIAVDGVITLGDDENVLTDGQGIIIFFNDPGKKFFRGIIHITGMVEDENGKLQKFHLRAFLLPPYADQEQDGVWAFVVKPAAKLGPKVRLFQLSGELTQMDSGNPPPPVVNKKLNRFAVSIPTTPITAGVPFNVTVTALDSDGNVLKSYKGKANVTDLTGSVKPSVVSNFVEGVFSGKLNITKSMNADKLTFTDIGTGKKGTSNAFDVKPAALAKLDLTPATAIIQPGSKASFTARVLDKFANEIPPSGFTFAWSLSSVDYGSISTSGNKANFTASSSIATESNVTLTVGIGALFDSSKITIRPAPAPTLDHFVITNVSSPKAAGLPFAISITAISSTGGTMTSYGGPIEISDTTDTLSITTNNGFSSGVWTGSVNITKASSSVEIKVEDDGDASKNGTSNPFVVTHGNLDHFKVSYVANQTAGIEFEFDVTAKDAYDNVVKNFNKTVTLSTNVGASPAGNASQITPDSYTFVGADEGIHTFKAKLFNATEDAKITVAGDGKSGSSNEFDVSAGPVDQVNVSPSDVLASLGQNVTFSAEATDAYDNIISGATFNWTLSSASLGSLDSTTGSSVKFTATSTATETINGALTATGGSESGTATIQVAVV